MDNLTRGLYALLASLALLVPAMATAYTLEEFTLEYQQDGYRMTLLAKVDVPASHVVHQFAEPQRIALAMPSTREARLTTGGSVYAKTEVCIWLLCRFLRQNQLFRPLSPTADWSPGEYRLAATGQPELSDFRYSRLLWKLRPDEAMTAIEIEGIFQPSFRIPPVIDLWLIRVVLEHHAQEMLQAIEQSSR